MSDLRPQSEPNRTLIRSLSPIAIFMSARPSTTLADLLREASHSAMRASPPSRSTEKSWPHFRPPVFAIAASSLACRETRACGGPMREDAIGPAQLGVGGQLIGFVHHGTGGGILKRC